MCRIASLFLLQRLKGSMSGDACDFNNIRDANLFPARHGHHFCLTRSLLPRRPGWMDNLPNFFWVACKS